MEGPDMNSMAIMRWTAAVCAALLLVSCAPSGGAVREEGPASDPVMGDWEGYLVGDDGLTNPLAVQAIGLGNATYQFVVRSAFPPCVKPEELPLKYEGRLGGSRLVFPKEPGFAATLDRGVIAGTTDSPVGQLFSLRRVVHLSPTMGARPPRGAIVLFDGTSLDAWQRQDTAQRPAPAGWKIVDGAMEVVPRTGSIITRRGFTDYQMHIEFRTPYMPDAREQGRGNSGVYMQGRYEIQVLDSYGLKGEDNECGGIYKVAAPRINMCAPPGQWQTYDITFHAPRFDRDGKKVADAVVTVRHNGAVIHEGLRVPGPTGGPADERVQAPGGIMLQDHGNLVQYRNIWLLELKE